MGNITRYAVLLLIGFSAMLLLASYFHVISLPTAFAIGSQNPPTTQVVITRGPQTMILEIENKTEIIYPIEGLGG